ncbi:sensor histidine kinase [Actinomadura sp. SCN-SB]|uniref:sensor histidine kinase n=1 Tax=Actinomadura sp. SCN-SB TaxID=3373092 RepID=UPI003753B923
MAVHASRAQIRRAALERALFIWLGAAPACGGVWLLIVVLAEPAEPLLAICGGAAVVALSAAIAASAYFADRARRARAALAEARSDGDRLERRMHDLVDGPLPALLARLADGQSPATALADFPPPPDPVVGRLLRTVVEGVASTAGAAARARMEVTALENEAGRLVDSTMPAVAGRIREGRAAAATALAEVSAPAHESMRRVLRRFADDLASGERTSAAAMASCASAAARIQAQTTRMLAQLRELEDRYGDDAVFGDLLALDHEVSQLGRLADSIALLSGGRSGRRWTKPIVMESILRGAMGRISAYRRVKYHSASEAAVAGFAAEGVMHVLAELMDNAANFSPHGSMVHVYVEEEDAGVVVTIEDSGLGMRRRERERAERLVAEAADLSSLPGTRLGLAVVGRLARKHELTISFRPSSRGGTGVVVLIPAKLISHLPPGDGPEPAGGPGSAGAPASTVDLDGDDGDLALPKRRRGAALAKAPASARAVTSDARPRDPGARFAAFHGSAAKRSRPAAEEPGEPPADPDL